MKKLLGTSIATIFSIATFAQITVAGKVMDAKKQPLQNATVILHVGSQQKTAITTADGVFTFYNIEKNIVCKLVIKFIGKRNVEETFISDENKNFDYMLDEYDYFLEPLEIKSIRATDKSPFTKTDINRQQIAKLNLGQDLPFLLNETPSVTINSDAGNGVGYTGIRIRGTDATRINVTLNGIPYNDAESQGTYFVDLPDFSSSVNSIQIQRGVGTSTNGAAAFGATINLNTNDFNLQPYAEINNSYGSFNTWKNTIKGGSGLINGHFTVDARLSNIVSDGYIDRATSSLQSAYFSAGYITKQTSLRLNIFAGKEKTYQAWYGVPKDSLSTNRTYNAAGTEKTGTPYNNQTDNYWQNHFQLFFNHTFNNKLALNIATFLTRGYGYYEEYKAAQTLADYGLENYIHNGDTTFISDLVRQLWLNNYFYGQIFSVQYKSNKDEITFGGSWTKYDGKHYGKVVWLPFEKSINYDYYTFPASKTDISFYTKWLHQINTSWSLFGDIQYRHVTHSMEGFEDNPSLFIKRNFDFANPKAGISYTNKGWHTYFSYALANKEPNRDDFEASLLQQPKKETLHDFEFGIERKKTAYHLSATLYYMLYKEQLVLTGKLNDVGNYTRTNVPTSFRAGIELQAGYTFSKWLNANGNFTFSKNKIKSFTEYLDNYDNGTQQAVEHTNTNISFSPSIIGNVSLNFIPLKNLEINALAKYVGKQYLDNTQNDLRIISSYFTSDVSFNYSAKKLLFTECNFILQVNNIFNKMYEPNGATYPYIYGGEVLNDNYYYPMAGTNFMLGLNIKIK